MNYSLLTAYCLLLTAYRSPFTIYDFYDFYDSALTAYRLPFTASTISTSSTTVKLSCQLICNVRLIPG